MSKFYSDGIIIANELITLCEKKRITQIKYEEHYEYTAKLYSYCEKHYDEQLVVYPERDGVREWCNEPNSFFECFEANNDLIIKIKPNASIKEIRQRYRAGLSYEALKTIIGTEKDLFKIVCGSKQTESEN